MANFFNILILEDVKSDALLIEYHLKKAEFKYQTKLVNNKPDFLNAIQKFNPDIILSDYNLPGFSGAEVLEICKEKIPDIPFLFVTGYLDENVAVNFIRKGAWDYILKQNYVRLIPAIENAVKLRNERLKVKLATNFLKKSKQRYQNLYEYAPDMYLTVNFETAFITECNETLAQVTGYQKSEIINHSVYSFYPANTATKIKDVIIPYVLQNGNIKNANLDIIKKDGSLINGLVNINAEYNKYNKIGSIRIVIRNITYRKTQEKALIESEERFKKIFNKSEDPTLILDYVGRKVPIIKNVNTNFVSKIGYQKKHLIGKPINFFLPHISDTEVENQIKKLLTGIKFHDKITLNLPHDITYYYDVVGSLIKLNNKDYILISARDITEKYIADLKLLKEKEKFSALSEEYKSQNDNLYTTIQDLAFSKKELKQKVDIINRSPAVAFLWKNEAGWPVEYVSENSKDFFGYKPKDFISGKIKYADVIHPEDIKRVIKEVEAGIKNNLNKISHKTYRIRTKKGEIKWIKDDTKIVKNNEKTIHFEGIITDITNNVKQQKALELSKNKYQTIIESNPDSIVITNENNIIEFTNYKAKKIFGTNLVGSICYKSLFNLKHPCDWCLIKSKLFNKQKEIEITSLKKRFLMSSSKIVNEDNSFSYITIYKDITKLRKVQSEKLNLLKTIEAGLNEIYIFNSNNFQFKYVNKRALNNLGLLKRDIIKLSLLTFQTEYSEEAFRNLIKPLIKGDKKHILYETIHRRKNNTFYPVEVKLQLIEETKNILAVINDISERIEKENTIKKLSTAVEQSPVTIIITDIKGNIEYINPRFTETSGYTFDEVIGKNPRILKSGEQNEAFYKNLWETINNGKIWTGDFHNKRKNGTLYWEKATISPVKNNDGKITQFIAIKEDITEHKIIQEKLKESELHFRKLFENSIIGMYLTTPDGKIINANKALCNMLEYRTFDELKNLNLEQNKDQSTSRSTFKAIIEKQNSIKGFESVWKTKTGQDIYVRESARKYIDENGNIFYEGTVENITKQKEAIKSLKEFHSFNKKIIKIGKLGSATFSKTGDCISVNQTYADIIGATREQVLKQNIYRTKTWKNFGLLINAKKCLSGGIQYKTIIESESSFNKQIWIEIHLSRIYKEKQAQLLVIIKDISSYMKAKQKQFQTKAEYINLIENVNVPVFGVDKNGSINEWNNTLQKLTGYKRNEVKRKKITEFIENSNDCKCLQIIKNASIGKENSNIEINFKTKSQKNLKLLISTTIRKDINNNLDGIIFIGQDITEIHNYKLELENRVEERTHKLIEALKKEKELGDLKSQFVSMASHEFRTPLAAISFASGFVKKYWSRLDELNRNLKLDKINDQVKHMTNLLNDVLTFGKTESGNISYNPKETNLISFLEEVIDEVQIATGNSHKILLNNKNGISMVMLDEKIGRNIFSNLLTNAIKFSPNTNFVTLKIQPLGSEVMIEVIDNGIGINQNEIDYIFTPFHRGQNVSTIQGTGLGLAIVKESVEIMKGTINVESTPGKGTKFKIIFPKNN